MQYLPAYEHMHMDDAKSPTALLEGVMYVVQKKKAPHLGPKYGGVFQVEGA